MLAKYKIINGTAKDLSTKQGPTYLVLMSRPLKAEYNADNIPEPLPDDMKQPRIKR